MREFIQAATIANQVRMLRTQHLGAFLLVEGWDDKRFFSNVIDHDRCRIVIAFGRANVVEALGNLEDTSFRGALGVVDADFSHLEGESPSSRHLIFTDTHDIETFQLASPAFEKLVAEMGSTEKIARFCENNSTDLRTLFLEAARPISYLRWLSSREGLALRFEGISFFAFLDDDDLTVDPIALIQEVKNKSQMPALSEVELRIKCAALESVDHDSWQLCCGHDVLEILSRALRKTLGSQKAADVDAQRLSTMLRLAYQDGYFIGTGLCRAIRQWEISNPGFTVLAATLHC